MTYYFCVIALMCLGQVFTRPKILMDLKGFEPLTSSVRLRRAPNCATGPFARGDYTDILADG